MFNHDDDTESLDDGYGVDCNDGEPKKHAICARSLDADLLYRRLIKALPREVITYEELSKIIRKDVRKRRWLLDTARRRALRENCFVFDTVTGVGLQCCDDTGRVRVGAAKVKTVRKAANKGIVVLATVEKFGEMSPELQAQHNTAMAMLGIAEQFAKPSTWQKINKVVTTTQRALQLEETLELFKKK
jgi:hypothetical protein